MDLKLLNKLGVSLEGWTPEEYKQVELLNKQSVRAIFDSIYELEYTQIHIASACATALYLFDLLEDMNIKIIIQEREKSDDGIRYTTEDIKRLRNQRSE